VEDGSRGRSPHRSGFPLDENDLVRIMSDHGVDGAPSRCSLCVHSDYWTTAASLQFFPARRRVRVAFTTACQAAHEEFFVERQTG
jgi:hypothetical protein